MEAETVLSLFQAAVARRTRGQLPVLTRETVIADAGLDSLALMETIGEIENELDVVIPDEDLLRLQTVGDVVDCVDRVRPSGTIPRDR
jgi:acyl carrier protein